MIQQHSQKQRRVTNVQELYLSDTQITQILPKIKYKYQCVCLWHVPNLFLEQNSIKYLVWNERNFITKSLLLAIVDWFMHQSILPLNIYPQMTPPIAVFGHYMYMEDWDFDLQKIVGSMLCLAHVQPLALSRNDSSRGCTQAGFA